MAAEEQRVVIPRVKLGTQGLEVSKLGNGCMGLSGIYNDPAPKDVGISIILNAFEKGITFFDTSDIYFPKTNEILIGKALKILLREKVQLATKFGIVKFGAGNVEVNGTPEYVRSCCEASLERLGVDYIDMYYQHRIDTTVPIEDTMGELKKLVEEGKIKYIGLSEASPNIIRRAHAVHPITTVQMEWSLWTRDIEEEIIPLCREFGIGIVPYSLIVHGFFGGKGVTETVPANSFLVYILLKVQQGSRTLTTTGSLKVKLTEAADMKEVSDTVPIDEVAGGNVAEMFMRCSWKFADTPPKA